jgi:cytochrome c oxidase subunit 3|tara:strand:+ start:169 stop:735 length:567 start_codon:yes stop_codon:yes gene_type:complete
MSTIHVHVDTHDRVAINKVGIWLFFLGETFLFGALISVCYYLQGVQRPDGLDQYLGLAITGILLLSSLTAYRAEVAAAHGDQPGFLRNLSVTILLGLLFLVGVGWEWYEAFLHFPPSTGFGTVFFTTTGIHAFHVLTGVIALLVVLFTGRHRGRFNSESHWGVEGTVKYWHFVDVAWVFIYPTLYLVS